MSPPVACWMETSTTFSLLSHEGRNVDGNSVGLQNQVRIIIVIFGGYTIDGRQKKMAKELCTNFESRLESQAKWLIGSGERTRPVLHQGLHADFGAVSRNSVVRSGDGRAVAAALSSSSPTLSSSEHVAVQQDERRTLATTVVAR